MVIYFDYLIQYSLIKSISLFVAWANDWFSGGNPREMGKVEKLSPSLIYSKSRSKRYRMTVKAVRRTDDENTTGRYASENTAMNMDETERATSETDENWQTVTNQRSNKFQKNQHACTNDNHEFLWTDGSSEFENWWSSLLLLFRGQWLTIEANLSSRCISEIVFNAAATASWWIVTIYWRKKSVEIQVLNDLAKRNDRLNVNTASYSSYPQSRHMRSLSSQTIRRPMKCYSRVAHGLIQSVDWHSKPLSLVEFPLPLLLWSIVFLVNGMSILWDRWLLNDIRLLFKWQVSFETDTRSTGFMLIFDRKTMFRRFSNARTFLSTAYSIQPILTSNLLGRI